MVNHERRRRLCPLLVLLVMFSLASLAAAGRRSEEVPEAEVASAEVGEPEVPAWRRQGPLPIEDFFSLSMGFLRLTPAVPRPLGAGEWELSVVAGVGNDFAQSGSVEEYLGELTERRPIELEELRSLASTPGADGVYRVDLEYYTTTLSVARGFGSGARLELAVPILDIEGGVFDSTIEGFHDLFGLNQAGRTKIPLDDTAVYLRSSDTEFILEEEIGKTLGDPRVTLTYPLRSVMERPNLFLRGTVKLPTANDSSLISSGSLDVGLQLVGEFHLGRRTRTYATLGAVYLGEHKALGVDDQWVYSGTLGWERPMKRRWNLVSHLSLATSPFSDLGLPELDHASIEVTIGARLPMRHGQIFLGITENLLHFNNSSDIGVSFGLSHSVGRLSRR